MNRLAVLFLALTLAGCRPEPTPPKDVGPLETFPTLAEKVNARQAKLDSLWAGGRFELWINDGKRRDYLNGDVTILYLAPRRLLLVGSKVAVGRVFDLGLAGDVYWMTVYADIDTLWHGRVDGRGGATLPIRPDAMLDVIGLEPLDAGRPRAFVYDSDADEYVLKLFAETGPTRIAREIRYDRETFEARRVTVFDLDGRPGVVAELSEYERVDGAGDARVPMRYRIAFPKSESRMSLVLDDVRPRRGRVPSDESFWFDPAAATVKTVIDLDAE